MNCNWRAMWSMEAVRHFEIQFSSAGEKEGFFEGQEVCGDIVLELSQDTVIDYLDIEFTGTARVQVLHGSSSWSRSGRAGDPASTCDESYLNQNITLYSRETNVSDNFLVPIGRHTFTFRIQLPYNLPSSIETSHGSIQYYATSTLTRPWHPEVKASKEFRLKTLVNLNKLPETLLAVTSEGHGKQSLLCCVVGSIQATWHLERTGFLPGQAIRIVGQIHNKSRVKIKKTKATLIQHVRYFNPTDSRYHRERNGMASLEKGVILPGASSFWREELLIPTTLPPTGLKGCTLMDVRYSLRIKVVPSGPLNSLESSTGITIGSVAKDQSCGELGDVIQQKSQHDYNAENSESAMEVNYFV